MEVRFCIYGFLHDGEMPPCDVCPYAEKIICDTYYALSNGLGFFDDEGENDEE